MTGRTTRYCYAWGPHKDHGDEALRDALIAIQALAFTEDKRMIEAQQHIIDTTGAALLMPTAHDRPVTAYNRLVERFVDAERSDAEQAA